MASNLRGGLSWTQNNSMLTLEKREVGGLVMAHQAFLSRPVRAGRNVWVDGYSMNSKANGPRAEKGNIGVEGAAGRGSVMRQVSLSRP